MKRLLQWLFIYVSMILVLVGVAYATHGMQ